MKSNCNLFIVWYKKLSVLISQRIQRYFPNMYFKWQPRSDFSNFIIKTVAIAGTNYETNECEIEVDTDLKCTCDLVLQFTCLEILNKLNSVKKRNKFSGAKKSISSNTNLLLPYTRDKYNVSIKLDNGTRCALFISGYCT